MKLAYQAFDKNGRAVADTIEANDMTEASERLRRQGLFVSEIKPSAGGAASGKKAAAKAGRAPKRRHKSLAMFTRQLQVLLATGTPLVQSLTALERQSDDPAWRGIIADIRRRIEEGATLSDALEHHPRCFDSIYRSLVAAGEAGGNLDKMLARLASLTRQQLKVRSSIIGTLTYPCLLLVVAVGVLSLMIGFILPRFEGLYETLDTPLPPTTKFLMWLSNFMRSYWWLVLGTLIPTAIGIKLWMKTPRGRRLADTAVITAPPFGKIVRSFATARIMRVLGVLVESHVPLLDALGLTRQSATNSHYEELVGKAEEAVTRGDQMSTAFAASKLVNPYVTEAIRNGEESGQVGPLLVSISDFLDEENEIIIKSLTSILEPMILILLGLMVGVIAISMFLPLFDLTSAAGGGG